MIKGGYVTFGHKIGVLMLDTKFPRPVGDMGNAGTWGYPVMYEVVQGATVDKVVKKADKELIPYFIKHAKVLESKGVKAITTNCGFIALFQKEIQAELNVPFISSNLMQIPFVYSIMGERGKIGILTASASTLTESHFEGVDAKDYPMTIVGMDDMPEFTRTIINNEETMNWELMRDEVVMKAKEIVVNDPEVNAIVLECTNLTPYLKEIKEEVGVPVFDIVSLINKVHSAI